jgi:hypothetical protein
MPLKMNQGKIALLLRPKNGLIAPMLRESFQSRVDTGLLLLTVILLLNSLHGLVPNSNFILSKNFSALKPMKTIV